MPALIWGIPAGLAALGFFVDKTGEGVESASNGIIKLAIAGGIGFFIMKKLKWI